MTLSTLLDILWGVCVCVVGVNWSSPTVSSVSTHDPRSHSCLGVSSGSSSSWPPLAALITCSDSATVGYLLRLGLSADRRSVSAKHCHVLLFLLKRCSVTYFL